VIRLALRVRRADAELVLADLLELAPTGVEEIELSAEEGGGGVVEYAVYGAPGELPELPDLQVAAGDALVDISTSEVPDDWSERWKRFHRPVLIEASARERRRARVRPLFVRPPWEAGSERADALEIVIDPAQAFGTGSHATTRMCLELLLELAASEESRGVVLDVGAGSGVLAIAAVKLGYGPVLALDNDRESVRAIAINAAVNDVHVEARRFDLRREALPWPTEDEDMDGVPGEFHGPAGREQHKRVVGRTVVLANLLRPLLLELADTMAVLNPPHPDPSQQPASTSPVSPAGIELIASGLLREQSDEVAEAFAKRLGLRERARLQQGDWAALWLTSGRWPRAPLL
jgi:ribosomal protein L11 methyltransferase